MEQLRLTRNTFYKYYYTRNLRDVTCRLACLKLTHETLNIPQISVEVCESTLVKSFTGLAQGSNVLKIQTKKLECLSVAKWST